MNDQILKRLDEEKVLEPKDMFKRCVGICMNQMSAKAGIKKHGEEAVSAISKEFGQLKHMKTFSVASINVVNGINYEKVMR